MGLFDMLGFGWGKKIEKFESLEEALQAVFEDKSVVFGIDAHKGVVFEIDVPESHEYKSHVAHKDGKVYLFVDVPVKVVLGTVDDASVNITSSGTSLKVSGSLDLRNTVEIMLSKPFGYLTGGRAVYRRFSEEGVVAEWHPLFAAQGELFFLQQMMRSMQRGQQASREVPVPEDLKERINGLTQIVARYSDRYIPLVSNN